LTWVFYDSVWQNKWPVLAILAAGFLGVMCQIQVFGLIIYYTRHFSSGEFIRIAGHTFDPRTSISLLASGACAVIVLLCLSSLCIYLSRRNILRMGRIYEMYCARRIFYLLGSHPGVFTDVSDRSGTDIYLLRLVRGDARISGRVLRMILSLIVPCLTLIGCIFVLLYMEIGFSMVIFLLGLIFLFCQYKVNRKMLEHSIRFERLTPVAAKELKKTLVHCKFQNYADENRGRVEKMFSSGPVKNQLDAFEGRLRATENSRFISGLFMAVILSLIILVMGSSIIREGSGWGRLLIYVVALRFAMTNLQATFTILTGINRFYPQLTRNYLFVKSFTVMEKDRNSVQNIYELHVDETTWLDGGYDCLKIQPGNILALITPQELNRYTLADIINCLLGKNKTAVNNAIFSMRFVTTRQSCPDITLRHLLGLSGSEKWEDTGLPEKVLFKLQRDLTGNLDTLVKPGVWEKLDPELKFALSLAAALTSDCQWIILEESGLHLLDQKYPLSPFGNVKDKIMVIIFNDDLSRVGKYFENFVAIMDGDSIMGLGPPEWFAFNKTSARDILRFSRKRNQSGANGVEDDDFDEI